MEQKRLLGFSASNNAPHWIHLLVGYFFCMVVTPYLHFFMVQYDCQFDGLYIFDGEAHTGGEA